MIFHLPLPIAIDVLFSSCQCCHPAGGDPHLTTQLLHDTGIAPVDYLCNLAFTVFALRNAAIFSLFTINQFLSLISDIIFFAIALGSALLE